MSIQSDYFNLIKEISGQRNVITVPRVFVKITGDLNQAVLLSQCIYWSDKTSRTDGFFYKTAGEFSDELGITARQVRYAAEHLEDAGFITTEIHRANGSPTTHYRVNLDVLTNSILQICKIEFTPLSNPNDASVNSLTDITTNIITTTTTAENRKNCYSVYEENIGMLTPFIADELDDLEKTFTELWLIEAMKEAAASGVRNLKYIKAILNRWKVQGYKSEKPKTSKSVSPQAQSNREAFAKKAERDRAAIMENVEESSDDITL